MSNEFLPITKHLEKNFLSEVKNDLFKIESDPFTEESFIALTSLLQKRIDTINILIVQSRDKVKFKKIKLNEAKNILQKEFEIATRVLHQNIKSILGRNYSPALHLAITYQLFAVVNDTVNAGDIPTNITSAKKNRVKRYYPLPKNTIVTSENYLTDIYNYEVGSDNRPDLTICWYLLRHLLDITPKTEAEKTFEQKRVPQIVPEKNQVSTPFFSELRDECISKLKSSKVNIEDIDIDSLFLDFERRISKIEAKVVTKGNTFSTEDGKRMSYVIQNCYSALNNAIFQELGRGEKSMQFITAVRESLSTLAERHSLSTLKTPDISYDEYAEEILVQEPYLPYSLAMVLTERMLNELHGYTRGDLLSRLAMEKALTKRKKVTNRAIGRPRKIEVHDFATIENAATFSIILEIEQTFLAKLNLNESDYLAIFLYLRSKVVKITKIAKSLLNSIERSNKIYNQAKKVPNRVLEHLLEELNLDESSMETIISTLLETIAEIGAKNELTYNASFAPGKDAFYQELGEEPSIAYSAYRQLIEFIAEKLIRTANSEETKIKLSELLRSYNAIGT